MDDVREMLLALSIYDNELVVVVAIYELCLGAVPDDMRQMSLLCVEVLASSATIDVHVTQDVQRC